MPDRFGPSFRKPKVEFRTSRVVGMAADLHLECRILPEKVQEKLQLGFGTRQQPVFVGGEKDVVEVDGFPGEGRLEGDFPFERYLTRRRFLKTEHLGIKEISRFADRKAQFLFGGKGNQEHPLFTRV